MIGDLRTDVWNDMVDTDRLGRYYGELAGKLASRDRLLAVTTTVLAMVSVAVASSGEVVWTVVATSLTVAASVVPLAYRIGGVVTSLMHCQKRFEDLAVEWRELWQEFNDMPPATARMKWQELAKKKNEITALMSSGRMDEKLRDSTEEQAYEYWEAVREVAIPAV